jgi:trk system potassium uptake protein TrkH
MVTVTGPLLQFPARAAFIWYAALIAAGACLLKLPQSVVAGVEPLSWIDAVFTSTSACCVTGLSVRSAGNDLSFFGQAVLLILIQLGGIGIMTVTTFIVLRFGVSQTLGGARSDLRSTIWGVIRMVAACEAIGFVLLAARNLFDEFSSRSLWAALFHSISAYCNAGFGLRDSSLADYRGDAWVNFTIMGLIISGGLGFPVISDLLDNSRRGRRGRWESLTMHSKMMLLGTVALLSLGAAAILLLEWNNALVDMPLYEKLLVAGFQSTTPRTAGFETVPMASLTNATLFVIMLLMLIGGGPCSTAGGFKVSTLMVMVHHAWSRFRGYRQVSLFRRSVPRETVDAALALGTVGLSTGMTPHLSFAAKSILIVLMFLGRLGPISVFVALSGGRRDARVEYPKEEVLIG